jgi:hypothetical protein
MRSLKVSAAALALILGSAGATRAQGVVPGGWSPEVGYHAVGASGQQAAVPYYGWNNGGSNYVVVGRGYGQNGFQPGYYAQPARTANNLGPLGAAVGRTTRPRRSR